MKLFSILLLAIVQATAALAVTPTIWRQNTREAFSQGEAVSVSVTRDGEVKLGPALGPFADTGEAFVWSIATGKSGSVYAGTGNDGRVYRLSDGNAEMIFDSPERAIFALHTASDGTVYAGSSPGGLIYAIPAKGEPRTFARTGDQHVWVLIGDGQGGLYAATGGSTGRVLRISKGGDVSEILVTGDPNVTSLVRAADGTLYAGTDQNGLIYRVGPGGKSDVLYDAGEKEIKALALGKDGQLFAGAMDSGSPAAQRGGGQNGRNGNGKATGGQSVVYSIRPSGSGWRLWDVPAPSVQALTVRSDGSLTVVTGGAGRIYRVFPDGGVSVVATVEDAQPWAFSPDGKGGGWIAASGSGQVFRLGSALARTGSLTSQPEDFSLITRWGRIRWEGETPDGASIRFEVRTGNSEVPDDTWSAWSAASNGIDARPARYIQYRATLEGDGTRTPIIREVMVSGLPENVQPMILELDVRGPHEEKPSGGGHGNGGRRSSPPSSESKEGWEITWTGADVNNDPLIYTLAYKGRLEKSWKTLAEDVTGNSYVWDTESAPEGDVLIRLTVSDSPTNPPELALSSERVSAPFKIDHTEPQVRIASVEAGSGGVTVKGTVTDETSFVKSAAYSLNSGDWQVVFPSDQVFDSGEEALDFTLSGLSPGEYTLVIRASDSRGNVGVAKRVFDVR